MTPVGYSFGYHPPYSIPSLQHHEEAEQAVVEQGVVDALLDSLSSEAHFSPSRTGFWTANLLHLIL